MRDGLPKVLLGHMRFAARVTPLTYQKPLTRTCSTDVGVSMCCQNQWDRVPALGTFVRENAPGVYQAGCFDI